MRLLLDTHLLIWAASEPERLSKDARDLIQDRHNELFFSVVSIWEMTIKYSLGKLDAQLEPRRLHAGLLKHAYTELQVTAEHALEVGALPSLHKDPFDRLLIAQAKVESSMLITSDIKMSQYPGEIQLV